VHQAQFVLLVAGALAVAIIARRFGRQPALVLVAAGLAISFIPGVPEFQIDPHLVLALILPPLLYSAALGSSYVNIKANVRPIALLAVGLVLATTVVVGFVAHLTIPGLPIASALVLGAVVAPPDAVAAVSIGRSLGLPRTATTLLTGESLVNDATALTAFKVALTVAGGTAMSWYAGIGIFLLNAAGGLVVGYVVGYLVHAVRTRLHNGVLESAVGILVPFVTYLLAEELQASGVLAVVVAGLYLGHNAPRAGYATRLQENAVWRALDIVLESVVFALIGLQLPSVIAQLQQTGLTWELTAAAALVLLATIVIRFAWVLPSAFLPPLLSKLGRQKEDPPSLGEVAVVGWAGMRGVVTLAAAFSVPANVPGHAIIVFLAFVVTVATLLLQGTTLPMVIRRVCWRGNESQADTLAEAQVQHRAAETAQQKLRELVEEGVNAPDHMVEQLASLAEHRGNAAWERLGRQDLESPASAVRRLRRAMLAAQREVFITARDRREIDDEVLRRVLRELDLEEAALYRD
jgi:CPA1 family monovalent cation:H+ antiporter